MVHIPVIQKHRTLGDVVGAKNQVYQSGLSGTGLSHQADILPRFNGKGHMLQGIEFSVGVAEGKVTEFNLSLYLLQLLHVLPVGNVHRCIQQLADPGKRGLAPGGHVDKLRHGHNGPDDGGKVADKLHQLSGVEYAVVHKIAAVAQNHADDALHEQANQDSQQHGNPGVVDVGPLIFLVQAPKGHQLPGLHDKGLNDGNAGKALLGKVREPRKALLAVVPLLLHGAAHDAGHGEQQSHGDQAQHRQPHIHPQHLHRGEGAQKGRVKQLQKAPAEAVLHSLDVIGEQTHQVAHLVHLVILPA